jgi:hypothetical protein
MKTKEKTRQPAESRAQEKLWPEMKEPDMTFIDRKIHDLLIAEGYRVTGTERIGGMKLNNYTNVNSMKFTRGERERVPA